MSEGPEGPRRYLEAKAEWERLGDELTWTDAFEAILKDLGRLGQEAKARSLAEPTLAEKVRFQRLQTAVQNSRRELLKLYYDVEDLDAKNATT